MKVLLSCQFKDSRRIRSSPSAKRKTSGLHPSWVLFSLKGVTTMALDLNRARSAVFNYPFARKTLRLHL